MTITPMAPVTVTDPGGRVFEFHPDSAVTGHIGDTAFDVERWRTRALSDRNNRVVVGNAAAIALSDRPQGREPYHLRTKREGDWWLIEAEYRILGGK